MLAAGLFLLATACSGSTATHATTVIATAPAATDVTAAGFPADFIGVSWATTATSATVSVYSATDGHLIRKLTVAMAGGGLGDPRLSPDGRTVIFSRGQGSCAQTIDTVPFAGGREQALVSSPGPASRSCDCRP